MKISSQARLILGFLIFSAVALKAQDVTRITTVDGQVYSSSELRKSGTTLFIKIHPDQGSGEVEIGLPFSRVAEVDFPDVSEMPIILVASKTGDAATVISKTESNIITQADFKDLPGSPWPELATLRLQALASVGRYDDASKLAGEIGVLKTPTAESLARGGTLFGPLASSDLEAVSVGAQAMPRLSGEPGAALAQLALGQSLLQKKDYKGALRAFLTIKVFYPSLTLLQPAALFGAANAYIGLNDLKRARQSLSDVEDDYPRSLQAPDAKKLEQKLSQS